MAEPTTERNFRSALHGFNREDVVAYIESLTLEQEKERRQLQDTIVRQQAELEDLGAKLAQTEDCSEKLREAGKALADCKLELEKKEAACAALEKQLADARAALAEQEQACEKLRGQTAAAPPLSAPIPPVAQVMPAQPVQKDYSELELAAYRRAEVTERLARERAADVYRQVRSVFGSAAARFDTGKNDLDQLTRTLQLDINQLLQLLSTIRSTYTEAEQSFRAVSEKNRELTEVE